MNVAAYIRLSKEDSNSNDYSTSIINQKLLIDNYLKYEKGVRSVEYYIDDGYSGSSFKRDALLKLLEDIKLGKIDLIVVKDLSRLGRNYLEVGNLIDNILPLYNVDLLAINDNYDSRYQRDGDSLLVTLKNVINEEYLKDMSKKIKSVLDGYKAIGDYVAPSTPFGYIKDPLNKHHLIIEKEASEVIKLIFKLYNQGYGYRKIAYELNNLKIYPQKHFTSEFISYCLHNDVYRGYIVKEKRPLVSYKSKTRKVIKEEKRVYIKGNFEPIISNEEFLKVKEKLSLNKKLEHKPNYLNNYVGKLYCLRCHKRLTYYNSNSNIIYLCSTYSKVSKDNCIQNKINKKELDALVMDDILKHFNDLLALRSKYLSLTISKRFIYLKKLKEDKLERIKLIVSDSYKLKDKLLEEYNLNKITNEKFLLEFSKVSKELNKYNLVIKELEEELKMYDLDLNELLNLNYYNLIKDINREVIAKLVMKIEVEEKKVVIKYLDNETVENIQKFIDGFKVRKVVSE